MEKNIIDFIRKLNNSFLGRIWLKNAWWKERIISFYGFLEKELSFREFINIFIKGVYDEITFKFRKYREKKVFELLRKEGLILEDKKIKFFGNDFYFENPFEMISQIYSNIFHDHYRLKKFIKDKKFFFDIGANIGVVSVIAANLNKEVEIFAFEPDKRTFSLLEKNLKPYFSRVHSFNFALGDKNSEEEFVSFYSGFGGNCLKRSQIFNASIKKYKNPQMIIENIKMRTLDSFVDEIGVKCDFIKIDVEGFEEEVLIGSEKTIKNFTPIIVIADVRHKKNEIINCILKINPKYKFEIIKEANDENILFFN